MSIFTKLAEIEAKIVAPVVDLSGVATAVEVQALSDKLDALAAQVGTEAGPVAPAA